MTHEFVDLNKVYREGIISSREYVDMAEWLATAENREDPNEIHLVNLRHALEIGVLSPAEYVCMADFFFDWLLDRLSLAAGTTKSTDESEGNFGSWRVEQFLG